MKRISVLIACLICVGSAQAQEFNNELGMGLLQLDEYGNANAFLNSNLEKYQFLPKFYFTKRLKNRWKMRSSFQQLRYKSNEYAQFVDVFPFDKKTTDTLISASIKDVISEISFGPQFDFIKRKKVNVYGAIEVVFRKNARSTFYKFKDKQSGNVSGYRHNDGPWDLYSPYNYAYYDFLEEQNGPLRQFQQTAMLIYRDAGIYYSLHAGIQYFISPAFSTSYEIGVHSYIGFLPVSRLSVNYHFNI